MKVSKVTISGMHKVLNKTYELNPGTTYFVGENGAGKSTILEAIQLALLGYIPGYAKTKESIMKHAAMNYMEIIVELDSGIIINRNWKRSGSGSVSSECSIQGYDGKIEELMHGIELPVFDFNEFTSMSANKLKEWFIGFLPSANKSLNLPKLLKDNLRNQQLPSDDLMKETEAWIKDSGLKGLDLVKGLNAHLKEEQSFLKGQIAKLQGTIESLIYYDDAPDVDEAELNDKLDKLNALKTTILRTEAQHQSWERAMQQLETLKATIDVEESNKQVAELDKQIEELMNQNSADQKEFEELDSKCREIKYELAQISATSATCPYTKEPCETAKGLLEKNEARRKELSEKLNEIQRNSESRVQARLAREREIKTLQSEITRIQGSYMQLKALEAQAGEEPDISGNRPLTEVDEEIRQIQNDLVKIAANKRYDELTQTVTTDKFAQENDLEVIKSWIKYTDANGLQTDIMNEPFQDLSDNMSKYLTQMFGKEVVAEFNLVAKANSFSFGLARDGHYIEFDCLSSGERCLFTLALMMCILNRSESQIRTILIDDLLDHLDGANATSLFKSLQSIEDIQFILAGVKECEESSICKPV